MYRLRFENADQLFNIDEECQISLPLSEISKLEEGGIPVEDFVNSKAPNALFMAEIPAVLWENKIENTKAKLRRYNIKNALCENIGAIGMCKELGINIHGGMCLNIINSVSADYYLGLGAEDVTLSFEMPFPKMRRLSAGIPLAAVVYGYLPLMKFRNCPASGENGCKGCSRENYLTDRMGEKFRIICRNSEYSELLNCVPLYAADKSLPRLDIYTLYYTVESSKDCEKIFELVKNKETPTFRRTAGLYNRELL